MIAWIAENIGTIIISIMLILVVSGIIFSLIRDRKLGRSSCGGNCASCMKCRGGTSCGRTQ